MGICQKVRLSHPLSIRILNAEARTNPTEPQLRNFVGELEGRGAQQDFVEMFRRDVGELELRPYVRSSED
jgi:hypothetical protein